MDQNQKTLPVYYQLLQNVLLDAFKVSTLYFSPPYTDIAKIDHGMRAAVWTNYNDENTKIHFSDSSQMYRILIIKSNLGFYNLLIILGSQPQPDFISIGPFRDEELSANYFTQIIKESHITTADIQAMKDIYERMPFIQADTVTNVTKHVLSAFIPQFKDIVPEVLQYSEQKRAVDINSDILENYSIEYAEQYRAFLFRFLDLIKYGDNINAKKALGNFLDMISADKKSIKDMKMLLHSLNHYCHIALMQTTVHPLHILRLSLSLRIKIDDITLQTRLEQIPNEICRKYCLLVKNYANPESSRLIKDVISYIQLHLDEELTLSSLAAHFQKNASVLSKTFSKETGQTLTQFVQQTRIREAVKLFNTTGHSVSEVSMMVGYTDFSYFSKVFTKIIGSSPREYKQHSFTHQDNT